MPCAYRTRPVCFPPSASCSAASSHGRRSCGRACTMAGSHRRVCTCETPITASSLRTASSASSHLAHPFDININIGTALQHERMRSRALALSATLALVLLPSQVPAAALPLLRTEWSASAAELGWVVSAYLLGYALAGLVVLPLTDRVPSSRVIAIGAFVTALANLAFAFGAHDVLTASVLRVASGFGLAGVYMPGVRLVAQDAEPARRGRAVGLYVAAFYLSGSLSVLATGLLLRALRRRGGSPILRIIRLLALPVPVASTRGIPHIPGERAHLDLRVLRNAPLVRTIAAYTGHSWELFIV